MNSQQPLNRYIMSKQIAITLTDSEKNVVGEYVIKRLSVRANARRLTMTGKIIELDLSDSEKGQLLTCAALASTLCDKKGELLYPEADGYEAIYDEMDIEEYDALCKAYVEVNPLESTLEAKKKKS